LEFIESELVSYYD
jgi:hypothetical protein